MGAGTGLNCRDIAGLILLLGMQAGPNLELLQPRKKDAIRVLGGADALRGMTGQVLARRRIACC